MDSSGDDGPTSTAGSVGGAGGDSTVGASVVGATVGVGSSPHEAMKRTKATMKIRNFLCFMSIISYM
jgi:hypothetical protein